MKHTHVLLCCKGEGTLKTRDGDKFTGEWIRGKPGGKMTVLFSNGDKYEGEMMIGKYHGHGKIVYHNVSASLVDLVPKKLSLNILILINYRERVSMKATGYEAELTERVHGFTQTAINILAILLTGSRTPKGQCFMLTAINI